MTVKFRQWELIFIFLLLCKLKIHSKKSKLKARKCSSVAGRNRAPDRMCRQFGGTCG